MNNFEKWKEDLTAEILYKVMDCAQSKKEGLALNCNACPANPDPERGSGMDICKPNCREHFFAWAKSMPPKIRQSPHYLVYDLKTGELIGCTTTRIDALLSKIAQKKFQEVECGDACPLYDDDCQKI